MGIVAVALSREEGLIETTFRVPALAGDVALATWALTRPVLGRREGCC